MNVVDLPQILLIDDKADLVGDLRDGLERALSGDAEIRVWNPGQEPDLEAAFSSYLAPTTALVVTDYDLTSAGANGLFGGTILEWCQSACIPAGDFSRGKSRRMRAQPGLFELRVPTDLTEAVRFCVGVFRGFASIRSTLSEPALADSLRSPAAAIAAAVGRPGLEPQFALYTSRVGVAGHALTDRLTGPSAAERTLEEVSPGSLLAYLTGHLLVNAVLPFPGPILSVAVLAAYLATTESQVLKISDEIESARYNGPFAELGDLYWRHEVDKLLEGYAETIDDAEVAGRAEWMRKLVGLIAKNGAEIHGCQRCDGEDGGLWCPFTRRAVCARDDCSVAANSWIPAGADLCQIERAFYDEWQPLLGL